MVERQKRKRCSPRQGGKGMHATSVVDCDWCHTFRSTHRSSVSGMPQRIKGVCANRNRQSTKKWSARSTCEDVQATGTTHTRQRERHGLPHNRCHACTAARTSCMQLHNPWAKEIKHEFPSGTGAILRKFKVRSRTCKGVHAFVNRVRGGHNKDEKNVHDEWTGRIQEPLFSFVS